MKQFKIEKNTQYTINIICNFTFDRFAGISVNFVWTKPYLRGHRRNKNPSYAFGENISTSPVCLK